MTPGIQELMRDVERIRDGFCRAAIAGDVEAALAMTADPVTVVNLPAGRGARDRASLRPFLEEFAAHVPAGLRATRLSRTIDKFRVVDEDLVSFVHDRELPWLVPGVPATHRSVEVFAISVVTVRQARILSMRTLWDQTGLLAQLGIERTAEQDDAAGWW